MSNKKYELDPVEIAGDLAMFSNPCGGSQSSSFPFPTPTALKGIIESINYMPQVIVRIEKIHICKNIKYTEFGFNASASHLRKSSQKSNGSSLQRKFYPLCDVIYQIYAYVEMLPREEIVNIKIPYKFRNVNHAHACQEIFNRKLKKGAYTHPPCLGSRKFAASYCGPIRIDLDGNPIYSPCKETNIIVQSMPISWFDKRQLGNTLSPSFLLNVEAKEGVVIFDNNVSIKQPKEGVLVHA